MKQTSIAVFDAYSLRLVRRLLVGRTSLRIILSDVGERRNGQNAVGYPVISTKTSGYPRLKSEAKVTSFSSDFRHKFRWNFKKNGRFSKKWSFFENMAEIGRNRRKWPFSRIHYQGKGSLPGKKGQKHPRNGHLVPKMSSRFSKKKKSRQLPHNLGFHRSGFWAAEILTSGLSVGISPANPAISGL